MDFTNIITVISGLIAAANAALLVYAAWQKLKPEVKKLESENDLGNLKNAQLSQQMLVDRINELEQQRKDDLEAWKGELEEERRKLEAQLEAAEKKRLEDVAYFKRRFKEADREARSYRRWAAALVKQVVEAGKVPAAFMPFTEDSDTGISAINDSGKDERGER